MEWTEKDDEYMNKHFQHKRIVLAITEALAKERELRGEAEQVLIPTQESLILAEDNLEKAETRLEISCSDADNMKACWDAACNDLNKFETRCKKAENKLNHEAYLSDVRAKEREKAETRCKELEASLEINRLSRGEDANRIRELESEVERYAKAVLVQDKEG